MREKIQSRIARSIMQFFDMPESRKNVPLSGNPIVVDGVGKFDEYFTIRTTDRFGVVRRYRISVTPEP